jgi:hypothetical protein
VGLTQNERKEIENYTILAALRRGSTCTREMHRGTLMKITNKCFFFFRK